MQLSNNVDTDPTTIHTTDMEKTHNPKFWHKTNCAICENSFWSLIKRKQKSCSAKCSGIYVAKNPNRTQKIKDTKLSKYGNSAYVNPNKAKLTCLSRYGVDNVSKSEEVVKKIKESNQKKFGVDWSFQAKDVIEKIKDYNLNNFGVESVSQRGDVKEKKIQTTLKNYGVDNPFQSEDVRKKIETTNLKKYGAAHPSKMDHVKKLKRKKFIDVFYKILLDNHKLNRTCLPLFSKDDYINSDRINRYKFQCKQCQSVFEDHIDGGHLPRCLKCDPLQLVGSSGSEREICEYVKSMTTGDVVENSRDILESGLELDIYLPDKKLAFEFNGLYWHSELAGKPKNYHLLKTEECEAQGIHLIQIFEDEWKNKKDIVKAKIYSKLVKEKRIGGRELIISTISSYIKNEFLIKHHIQGKDNSSICYGAFYDKELVSVITFMKPRLALGNKSPISGTYELVRFATSRPVVGVLLKFIKKFKVDHTPTKIISYADRRFTSTKNNIYNLAGFIEMSKTPPNYWYFRNGYFDRKHRFVYRKSEVLRIFPTSDNSKTEWQIMQENGYNRIWDCGNIKYEMNL